jgi:transposase
MRIIRKRCLGLDLHKKQITAHLRVHEGSDREPVRIGKRFGTMPAELERLREWVAENQVTDVVMESTGVYWMHLYELLEPVTTPAVVNASHVKKVPGRKTDVGDAEWLADLHAHGLIRLSFVPPKEIRELRALTRYRTKLVAMQTATRNRTIKMLEIAGIKLSSVVSDSFGATGRGILDALTKSNLTAGQIEPLTRGSLRQKVGELTAALAVPLSDLERDMLAMHLRAYDAIDAQIADIEVKMFNRAKPYAHLVERLDAVPGINPLAAITVLAETGIDMSVYRHAHHLTALAGLAPGNNVSDRKRRSIGVRKGNRYLKRICVQIAWAVSRKKDSFLRARFSRLSRRIGRNKAIVATARQILVIIHHLLAHDQPYRDIGANYYDQRHKARVVRNQVRRLEQLGFIVALKPTAN